MPDFHDDERREGAKRVFALVTVLRSIADRLEKSISLPGGPAMEATDDALNELVAVLGMWSPLAHRRHGNGKVAFMWIDVRPDTDPAYHWVVCDQDGSCHAGHASSQRLCEEAVDRLLHRS